MKNTVKKSSIAINPIEKTITITNAYYKRACSYGTPEYYEFRQIMSENEGFSVEFKVVKKKTYKDLRFARMEAYIKTQPNSEKQLIAFESVQTVAEQKGAKYPLTKKWFLENYPEYKINDVSESEIAALVEAGAAQAPDLALVG